MASRFGGVPLDEAQTSASRFGGVPIDDRPKSENFIAQIGSSKLGQAVGDVFKGTGNIIKNIPNQNPASSSLQLFGQSAKALATPIGMGLSQLVPDSVSSYVSDSAVGDVARQYGEKWNQFSQESPEMAANIGAAANLATLPLGKAATITTAPVVNTAKKIAGKFEDVAAKAPGILGDTKSGVSLNASIFGVPETVASVPQGFKNRLVGATKALKPDEIDDVLMQQGNLTSGLYKSVDETGASLKPTAASTINANVLKAIDGTQINPVASPKTIGAVKELYNRVTVGKINPITGEVTQAPLTVSELDGYRKLLSNISGEDAVVAGKVRDAIDSSLKSLSPTDFNGGGIQAAKLLVEARASAAKGFKLQQIGDIIKKADGNTIAIKRGFKKLIDEKGWERGFSPAEIKAIKNAAQYGTGELIERGLGTFGLDFGKTKNVALPVLTGGSVGLGVPGGVPLVAAGTVTRQTGKFSARGKAQNVFDVINKRR